MKRQYTLEFWVEDGWYVGRLKEIPGVCSQGETLDDLESNILDAYQMMMADTEPAPGLNVQHKQLLVDV